VIQPTHVASAAVWAFAIIIAVNQLGIGATLVNTWLMRTVGALALGIGLAFGLGGKETAGKIEGWYAKGKEAAPKVAVAGDAAKQQGQEMKEQAKREAQQIQTGPRGA